MNLSTYIKEKFMRVTNTHISKPITQNMGNKVKLIGRYKHHEVYIELTVNDNVVVQSDSELYYDCKLSSSLRNTANVLGRFLKNHTLEESLKASKKLFERVNMNSTLNWEYC